jgi:arylsulfatase A-like enzyme
MRTKSFLIAGLVPLIGGTTSYAQQKERPNVIFILTDDMGIGDLSCYGASLPITTPHLDQMASEGIRFTQYYCASPISSPSRAGLLTGQHPARWNITSYLQSKEGNRNAEMADYLDPKAPSLPRMLKESGYKTAHFGKWHLGGGRDVKNAPSIIEYGYDEYASTYESPDPDPLLTASDWIWSENDSVKRWERSGYFVDKTIDFLKRNKGTPCFINLWPDDVHTPWIGNEEQMTIFPDGSSSMSNFLTVLKEYDRQMGLLMQKLKEEGFDKNTIVIFTSDNGPGPSLNHIRTNGLRGCKASLFEGGIRMPFIVWSGGNLIPNGRVDSTTVISAMDMLLSLSKIGNAPVPFSVVSDGEDMSKALLGTAQKRNKEIYWEYRRREHKAFPSPEGYDKSPNICIRQGDWKLLVSESGTWVILYDLKQDPYETHNVSKKHPEVVEVLKKKALDWRGSLPKL